METDSPLHGVGGPEVVEHDGARPGEVGGHRHAQGEHRVDYLEEVDVDLSSQYQTLLCVDNKEVSEHQVDTKTNGGKIINKSMK